LRLLLKYVPPPDGDAFKSWWEQTLLTMSSKQKVQMGVGLKLVNANQKCAKIQYITLLVVRWTVEKAV